MKPQGVVDLFLSNVFFFPQPKPIALISVVGPRTVMITVPRNPLVVTVVQTGTFWGSVECFEH